MADGGRVGGGDSSLPPDPLLQSGVLPNGFQFMVRPTFYAPNRISAWLEVGVGSLAEERGEEGIAHVLEHCVFVGTESYAHSEMLRSELTALGMSWGADSNAYTDYRSTVYTLEAPFRTEDADVDVDVEGTGGSDDDGKGGEESGSGGSDSDDAMGESDSGSQGEPGVLSSSDAFAAVVEAAGVSDWLASSNLPRLLHILQQLVFKATFPPLAVEKEKIAVLSEAAMRNTPEYRVEVAMSAQTHEETCIPHRLPIGLTSVVRDLTVPDLQRFYRKWYQPQHMTLYIAGPFIAPETKPAVAASPVPIPAYDGVMRLVKAFFGDQLNASVSPLLAPRPLDVIERSQVGVLAPFPNLYPPLPHCYDHGPQRTLIVAQSPLLTRFALSISSKRPLLEYQLTTTSHFRTAVLDLLLNSVFDSRVSALRNTFSRPPFSGIQLDDAPSGEEGCAFRGLHVSVDLTVEDGLLPVTHAHVPHATGANDASGSSGGANDEAGTAECAPVAAPRWFQSVVYAVRHALALARFGVQPNEFKLAAASLLKEFRDTALAEESVTNEDLVSEMQQGLYSQSTVSSSITEYELLTEVLPSVTPEEVSARAKEVLDYLEVVAAECQALAGKGHLEPTDLAGFLRSIGRNISMFVCAPGPTDTLVHALPAQLAAASAPSDTPAAIAGIAHRAGLTDADLPAPEMPPGFELGEARVPHPTAAAAAAAGAHGVPGGGVGDGGVEAMASPTLFDRLQRVSSRRAKLARMTSADDGDEGVGSGDVSMASTGDGHAATHVALLPYTIEPFDIVVAIAQGADSACPAEDIILPESLIAPEVLAARQAAAQAVHALAGVPYGFAQLTPDSSETRHVDSTGIVYRQCSNGITVVHRKTAFEPNIVGISVVARGGKDVEGNAAWRGGLPVPTAGTTTTGSTSSTSGIAAIPSTAADSGAAASGVVPPRAAFTLCPTFNYGPLAPPLSAASESASTRSSAPAVYPNGTADLALRAFLSSSAGPHSVDAIERFCNMWGLSISSSMSQEAAQMAFGAVVGKAGIGELAHDSPLAKLFQLMHMYLTDCNWDTLAFNRCLDEMVADLHHLPRSLERATNLAIMQSAFGTSARFTLPTAEEAALITLTQARQCMEEQLTAPNLQVTIVGDFEEAELESLILQYLAPLPVHFAALPRISVSEAFPSAPLSVLPYVLPSPPEGTDSTPATASEGNSEWMALPGLAAVLQARVVHVRDAEARCHVSLACPMLGKYGLHSLPPHTAPGEAATPGCLLEGISPPSINRAHLLFMYRSANIWLEVLNNRLYRRLRDDTGACYSVSFSASGLEFCRTGFGTLMATPLPSHVPQVVHEGISVLLALLSGSEPITSTEFEEARRPLVQTVRSSLQTNGYWHSLGTYLCSHRSWKGWDAIHDITAFYECVSVADVQHSLTLTHEALPMPLPVHVALGYSGDVGTAIFGTDPMAADDDTGSAGVAKEGGQGTAVDTLQQAATLLARRVAAYTPELAALADASTLDEDDEL